MTQKILRTGFARCAFSRLAVLLLLVPAIAAGQIDEDETGAWYMYIWNVSPQERNVGFQGDIQYRNWDTGGDLEQLLIRGAVSLQPEDSRIRYAFGLAHITSGTYGDDDSKLREERVYQELTLPGRVGKRFFLTHRFRFEQRWVDGQDFRLRLRYFFGVDIPLNQLTMDPGAWYLSMYNELFLNANKDIGNGLRVELFDRNRLYLAVGRTLQRDRRLQFGYMHQQTNSYGKDQLQFTLLQRF